MKVRIYACRTFDEILQTWTKARKYTLEDIAKLCSSDSAGR
jgi:hypothetical protein